MDDWGGEIAESEKETLIIIEGLTMYLTEAEVRRVFDVIAGRFARATVLAETMNPGAAKALCRKIH